MSLSPAPKHVLNSSLRPALFAAAVLFLTGPGPRAQEAPDTARFGVRPTFGAGIGMFAFLGDIGHGHKNYSPLLTRVGYEFRAGTPSPLGWTLASTRCTAAWAPTSATWIGI
ncbi:MAG: hypothetical protein IPH53_20145 [Flavobacteriales bacterium]|nr:hypothetical protein [Flavobacteriales bacterium]